MTDTDYKDNLVLLINIPAQVESPERHISLYIEQGAISTLTGRIISMIYHLTYLTVKI